MPRRPYRPRPLVLRNGRSVTLRAVRPSDADELRQAFDRLSSDARYSRFMHHKKNIDGAALARGVRPRPGRDFVLVATVPADDGIDIVGAVQFVPIDESNTETCEFAITVADAWHGQGLARQLLACAVRRARHDGYAAIEGFVLADNHAMLGLARRLKFERHAPDDDPSVVRVVRRFRPAAPAGQALADADAARSAQ